MDASLILRDFVTLVRKAQNAILFSVASVLQEILQQYFVRFELLAATITLSITLHELSCTYDNVIWHVLKQSAVVQTGQSVVNFIDSYAMDQENTLVLSQCLSWLLQTCVLCLPAMLQSRFKHDEYIQNAVTVFLYQYAATLKSIAVQIDFGTSSFFVVIFVMSLTVYWHDIDTTHLQMYKYILKGTHMLLVELLFDTIVNFSRSHAISAQITLQMLSIFCMDSMNAHVETFLEVRGYAVWRLARTLYSLSQDAVDAQTTIAASILVIFVRYIAQIQAFSVQSQFSSSVAELLFLVALNHLLLPIVSKTSTSTMQHLLMILSISITFNLIQIYIKKKKSP